MVNSNDSQKFAVQNIRKCPKTHDQRPLVIKEILPVNFAVYNTPFIRAMNKMLISVSISVSVYHLSVYHLSVNSQHDMK